MIYIKSKFIFGSTLYTNNITCMKQPFINLRVMLNEINCDNIYVLCDRPKYRLIIAWHIKEYIYNFIYNVLKINIFFCIVLFIINNFLISNYFDINLSYCDTHLYMLHIESISKR